MGLDFSHCNANWSYSGFHHFRKKIAMTIGVDLPKMEGFGGDIQFNRLHYHPLQILLNHSDCDGEIPPEQCRELAPALRKAVEDWPSFDYDKLMALELAEGLESAADNGEHLRFF